MHHHAELVSGHCESESFKWSPPGPISAFRTFSNFVPGGVSECEAELRRQARGTARVRVLQRCGGHALHEPPDWFANAVSRDTFLTRERSGFEVSETPRGPLGGLGMGSLTASLQQLTNMSTQSKTHHQHKSDDNSSTSTAKIQQIYKKIGVTFFRRVATAFLIFSALLSRCPILLPQAVLSHSCCFPCLSILSDVLRFWGRW